MPSINPASTREEEELLILFKNLFGTFNEFSMLLIAFIAAKFPDSAGESLFTKKSGVMMALVVTTVLYYLALIAGTVLQLYIRNLVPILTCIILCLGSLASVLALSIVSSTVALITAILWICVFTLVACYYYEAICTFMSSAAQTIKNLMY